MPHLTSFSGYFFGSPRNEWSEYMDEQDSCGGNVVMMDNFGDVQYEDHYFNLASYNPAESTAARKHFFPTSSIEDESYESQGEWSTKEVRQWLEKDVITWVISTAVRENYDFERIHMHGFNVDGVTLESMTETEFMARSPEFGCTLYRNLQNLMAPQLPPFGYSFEKPVSACQETRILTDLTQPSSDYANIAAPQSGPLSPAPPQPPVKRLPGRPRGTRTKKKPEKPTGRLWEFIRDLLLNREYCPSLICWDDHDKGIFRFVHSEKVARLWGTRKENPKMNYEKLSRAMRYYYKSKVLQPVLGRRLVYKFGPTATGWQTPNPNFRNPE